MQTSHSSLIHPLVLPSGVVRRGRDDAPVLRHAFDLKETKRSFGGINCSRSRDVFSIVASRLSPDLTSDFQSELKRKAKGQIKVTGGYGGKSPQVRR